MPILILKKEISVKNEMIEDHTRWLKSEIEHGENLFLENVKLRRKATELEKALIEIKNELEGAKK